MIVWRKEPLAVVKALSLMLSRARTFPPSSKYEKRKTKPFYRKDIYHSRYERHKDRARWKNRESHLEEDVVSHESPQPRAPERRGGNAPEKLIYKKKLERIRNGKKDLFSTEGLLLFLH